ncbi:MAG TPA: DUF5683 domain-containing protein [candidate division Zixibacteria bacterium]|nr:PEGA domain-containing protein [candidate division Zixibacteria bacterium]MDD4918473.1 DUF5683 domain-containing protein [candidate division Zixibacteria bacterium]MDM7971800.1 DUF5683 domain-containing protein [candidate division Zixibacteria bacterium]HOD65910.1 DUF5683 domain-containing protein [candidate division Zixibacteria bacterium]HPM37184.1 DUF5683 domain-containing protein [candidate division Zixibacteria bacterium]
MILAAALAPVPVAAQADSDPGVIVRTDPPGCLVTLRGEIQASGVAPVHFRQLLIGDYRLKVERPGWETYSSRLVLDPTKQVAVDVNLSRKTRFKGAVRSLVIPGWGQRYADKDLKAGVSFGMALASGAAFLLADDEFDYRHGVYNEEKRKYLALPKDAPAEVQQAMFNSVKTAHEKAVDAENVRRATIGAAIGVWALSLLDAVLFFPSEQGTFSIKGVAVAPGRVSDGYGVTLSGRF